jgi:hypothetical protein
MDGSEYRGEKESNGCGMDGMRYDRCRYEKQNLMLLY